MNSTHVCFYFSSKNHDYSNIEIKINVSGTEDHFFATLKITDCFTKKAIVREDFYASNFTVVIRRLNKVLKNELDSADLEVWYKQNGYFTGLEFYFPLKSDEFDFSYYACKGDVRYSCNK